MAVVLESGQSPVYIKSGQVLSVLPGGSIIGATAPSFTLNGTSDSVSLVAGTNITLSTNLSTISIIGATFPAATDFSLNGSSSSVSLIPGSGIGFASNLSSITISVSSVATNFSLNGSSSSASLVAGAGIGFASNNSTITVSVSSVATNFSLNGSSSSVSLVAGANITFNSNLSTITIVGPTVPTATNFSLNGTSSSVSLVASNGIAFASGASSISISYSGTSNFTGISLSGNTASTTAFSGNSLILSAAGILSLTGSTNASGGTITMSVPAPAAANTFTLNGTTDSVSISAGAGIGIGQANSTITISASVQSAVQDFAISSSTAGGVTQGTTTAASGHIQLVAGSNITLSSSAGAITVIAPSPSAGAAGTQTLSANGTSVSGTGVSFAIAGAGGNSIATATAAGSLTATVSYTGTSNFTGISLSGRTGGVTAFSGNSIILSVPLANGFLSLSGATNASGGTITISAISGVQGIQINNVTAGGATSGTTTAASGFISFAAGSNITLSSSINGITIIGPAPTVTSAGTQTIAASGTSITGTAVSLSLVAGAGVSLQTATGAGSMTVTFVNTGVTTQAPNISYTQNASLNEINLLTSKSGTITGTAGFGSSLFLQRIFIPYGMKLTEVDLLVGLNFAGISSGAGTMSRSFILYSIQPGGSNASSVLSASSAYVWSTGSSTTLGATSISQFAGMWNNTNMVPLTFASTSVTPGEYMVGNQIDFGQGSSTWTVSLFGMNVFTTATQSAISGLSSTTFANQPVSAVNNIPAVTGNGSLAITNVEATATWASSTTTLNSNWRGMNAIARTIVTSFGTAQMVQNIGLSTVTAVSSIGTAANTFSYAGASSLLSWQYMGTGSSVANNFPPPYFNAAIVSTSSLPAQLTTNVNVAATVGSTAQVQPWFALVGA